MKIILKGVGASQGKIKGKVKIVKSIKDSYKFKKGNILVTKITDPTMVIMMNKAAAIVCDMGGMTSHPAIVSREMGIPCVVATKTATRDLKDGMEIIVDGKIGKIFQTKIKNMNKVCNLKLNWMDQYLQSVENCFKYFSISTIRPIDWMLFHPLYADLMTDKLSKAVRKAKRLKLNPHYLADTFRAATILGYELLYNLLDSQSADLSPGKQIELANFFNNLLKNKCKRDYYLIKSAIVHSKKEIKKIISEVPFQKASCTEAKVLGKMSSTLSALIWGLYADAYPNQGMEIYGPYKLRNGSVLIIKTYYPLKPTELWPETKKFKYNSVIIYSIYKDIDIKLNLFNHLTCNKNLVNHLYLYAIRVDNQFIISTDQIDKLRKYLEQLSIKQYLKLQKLSFKELKIKFLEMRLHQYKDLFKKLRMNWRPSRRMVDRIKDEEILSDKFPKFQNKKEELSFWKDLLDPRVNFFIKGYRTKNLIR